MARKRKISPGLTDGSEPELPEAKKPGRTSPYKYAFRDLSTRFTKSPTAADLDLSLCPRCRVIDLDAVMEAASAGEDLNGIIIAEIAPLTEAVTASTCRLCAFLSHDGLRRDNNWGAKTRPLKLCAFDSLTARGFFRTKARIEKTRSIVLVLLYRSERWYKDKTRRKLVLPYSWPRAAAQQPSTFLYCAREICTSSINYDLIKEWLRDCESGHKSCRLHHPVMKPAKVIDCMQHEVVPCTAHNEYLALSYVWGQQSESDKESTQCPGNGKLPYQIPKVISDAMTIVLSLGYKYLWVDRFCIDQENAEEKHDQISRMDEVYEGALATIVAASSKAADGGIPGVSVPRDTTPCVRLSGKLSLQACLPSVRLTLIDSKWNERGWTYQEFCLSRRCLIFADDQVRFICKRGTTCEGVKEGALSNLPVAKWRCLDPSILEKTSLYTLPLFARHMSAYTCRTLSYDSDKLNAFRGVLSRSQIATYWGVPVYNYDLTPELARARVEVRALAPFHMGFSWGLCWQRSLWHSHSSRISESNTDKINGLPSWSWVSCRTEMGYSTLYQKKNDAYWFGKDAIKYFAEVYLDDPSSTNQERLITLTRPSRNHSRMIHEWSPFIYIRSVVKKMGADVLIVGGLWWDSGNQPKCSDYPFLCILLMHKVGHRDTYCKDEYLYMIVKMEGDVTRRVGLAGLDRYSDSRLENLGVRTIKVA